MLCGLIGWKMVKTNMYMILRIRKYSMYLVEDVLLWAELPDNINTLVLEDEA